MIRNLTFICFLALFFTSFTIKAGHCIDEETVGDLNKSYKILVVGKVVEKKTTNDSRGNVKMKIIITKNIKGKMRISKIDSYTSENSTDLEKSAYTIGKSYIFPIVARKNKNNSYTYRVVTQVQGCELFLQE